jgi:argininosuccinate lyase
MSRLWDKGLPLDDRILRFTAGEDYLLDGRLVPYDVRASIAHAQMLAAQTLISEDDCNAIVAELEALAVEHSDGKWSISLEDEDVHGALEARLRERIGDAGGRVHLGRSRNDQVLAALRLYLRDAVTELCELTDAVVAALHAIAKDQGHIELPGYTHMQPAMPSTVALWANGFAALLADGRAGLERTQSRINLNPLGSAAGYGVPGLPLDREATRSALGFEAVQEPVTAVQLSRGRAEAAVVFELNLILADVGRLATDLLLFYTDEFAYITLPQQMTTGSSIMPQKRNPDVFELLRGAPATTEGALVEIVSLTAKLSSGYHRDLQRLKAPLFRSIDLAVDALTITAHALPGIRFNPERIRLPESLHAAEKANALVLERGIPFREAYRIIAKELFGDESNDD